MLRNQASVEEKNTMILQINEFHVDICEGAEFLIYTENH